MKTKHQGSRAFTGVELAIVVSVIALLFLGFLVWLDQHRVHGKSVRIQCVNNQKQIGTAYRIWAGDNNEKYPADVSNTSSNGGWHKFVSLTNAGQYCWSNYAIMSTELGFSPRVLTCPVDVRKPARDFKQLQNANLSYFCSPSANENFPLSILAGDRNLALGTVSKNDFGFSPENGRGNDIILQTKTQVCWSLKMHSAGSAIGAGNLLMGDGSVQQCSSARLRSDYIANAATPSNFPTAFDNPQSNSFRLIFP